MDFIRKYINYFIVNMNYYPNEKLYVIKKLTDLEFLNSRIIFFKNLAKDDAMFQVYSENKRKEIYEKMNELIDEICNLNLSLDTYKSIALSSSLENYDKVFLIDAILSSDEFVKLDNDFSESRAMYIYDIVKSIERISKKTEEELVEVICSELPLYCKQMILRTVKNFSFDSIDKIEKSIKLDKEKIEKIEESKEVEEEISRKETKNNIQKLAFEILVELGFDEQEDATKYISKLIEILYHKRKVHDKSYIDIDGTKEKICGDYKIYNEALKNLHTKMKIVDSKEFKTFYDALEYEYDILAYEIVNNIIKLYDEKDYNENSYVDESKNLKYYANCDMRADVKMEKRNKKTCR